MAPRIKIDSKFTYFGVDLKKKIPTKVSKFTINICLLIMHVTTITRVYCVAPLVANVLQKRLLSDALPGTCAPSRNLSVQSRLHSLFWYFTHL